MAYIYQITNDINGKIYIGKTEFSIEKRFKEHCNDAFKNRNEKRPLYSAMRKYGIEHFHIDLIEETNNPEEKEIYWIQYFNSSQNGYNATLGGDGKRLYNYNDIIQLILNKKTITEISNIIGCSKDTIINIAKNNNINIRRETSKMIIGKSKNSNRIYNFDSSHAAARWLVDNNYTQSDPRDIHSKISQVCRGKRKSAYGFIWSYL